MEWVAFPSPGDLHNLGIKPRSPTLQADSLPTELSGKPKNTGVGILSLLQEIFLTQESNRDLLHCRWILRQLSYQEAPKYLCPWHSPGENTGVGGLSLLQGNLPNPGIQPRSPPLQGDSLPAEPQGKPKNIGVGSLSLLQRIFPNQESNRGLLRCIIGRFFTS